MQADKPAVAPQGHLYRGVPEPFLAKNGQNGILSSLSKRTQDKPFSVPQLSNLVENM
jgi:hypothetical protein